MIIGLITGSEWVTIIGALGILATIVGGVIVNILGAWFKEQNTKLAIIESKVDGTATTMAAKLDSTQKELAVMNQIIADQKQVAAVLAATKVESASIDKIETVGTHDSIEKISDNLKIIPKNKK